MGKKEVIQIFEERKVRTVWDDEQEKWYFCVADVVEALTDSVNPTDYIKKMKKRDPELAKGWGQIVTPLSVLTAGGKQRVNCTPQQGVFRMRMWQNGVAMWPKLHATNWRHNWVILSSHRSMRKTTSKI